MDECLNRYIVKMNVRTPEPPYTPSYPSLYKFMKHYLTSYKFIFMTVTSPSKPPNTHSCNFLINHLQREILSLFTSYTPTLHPYLYTSYAPIYSLPIPLPYTPIYTLPIPPYIHFLPYTPLLLHNLYFITPILNNSV